MNKLEEINVKISANKEVLGTLPKNNEKNRNNYVEKVSALLEEFKGYETEIVKELEKRSGQIKVTKNPELDTLKKQIEEMENSLYLLNPTQTSYEKMGIDKEIQNLRSYYKKSLETVNEAIVYCINKFKEVGNELKLEDFCYSKYAREYLEVIFDEMKKGDIKTSDKIKTRFDDIYWKCPDIITHIQLNIRYLYLKNEKSITKYYDKKKEELLKKSTPEEMMNQYFELKKQYIEKTEEDKYNLTTAFIEGELKTSEYATTSIERIYEEFIPKEALEGSTEDKLDEIDTNMRKLLNSIYEYKNYLKYKFVVDEIKVIYSNKERYKSSYETTKKEISKIESKIIKLNNETSKKSFFKKNNEKKLTEQNNLILEVKALYKELDNNKVYNKVYDELNDNTTTLEVLNLADSFYSYLFNYIRDNDKEKTEEEIRELIDELGEFLRWPYITLLSNIEILEEKDILLIIKDRYQLLNINLEKQHLQENSLEQLEGKIAKIVINHNIKKNKIDVEEIESILELRKVLNQ